MTVGDLMDRLVHFERSVPVRLAINPLFPMTHGLASAVTSTYDRGRPVVYLAETGDQLGYLPPEIAASLTWQTLVHAPGRRRAFRHH